MDNFHIPRSLQTVLPASASFKTLINNTTHMRLAEHPGHSQESRNFDEIEIIYPDNLFEFEIEKDGMSLESWAKEAVPPVLEFLSSYAEKPLWERALEGILEIAKDRWKNKELAEIKAALLLELLRETKFRSIPSSVPAQYLPEAGNFRRNRADRAA